jgi:type IX secretion system PorP/SprF family membrane protein
MAQYRHQWTGLEGAPKTAILSGHAPLLNDKIGIGVTLINDNVSVFNATKLMGSYAYRVRVGDNGKLCFGMNVEVTNFRANWNNLALTHENDNVFLTAKRNVLSPNFGAGVYYYSDKFYVGASVPHFLNMSLTEHFKIEGTDMVARQWKHYFFSTGAIFKVSHDVEFKPSVLLKYVRNTPIQADINVAFLFREALWLGAGYRTGDAVTGMIEYNFSKGLRIGYSYDYTTSELNDYSSGTHEVMVSYEFQKKQSYLTPRRMSAF